MKIIRTLLVIAGASLVLRCFLSVLSGVHGPNGMDILLLGIFVATYFALKKLQKKRKPILRNFN